MSDEAKWEGKVRRKYGPFGLQHGEGEEEVEELVEKEEEEVEEEEEAGEKNEERPHINNEM